MENILYFLSIIVCAFFIGILIDILLKRLLGKFAVSEMLLKSLSRLPLVGSLLIGVYIGIPYLDLNEKLSSFMDKLIIFSLILLVFLFISKLSVYIVETYIRRISENLSATLFKSVTFGFMLLVGLLVALQTVGISVTPILTALGVGGLAVALALQDTLANIFAGIHLIVTRQVRVGDYIRLESGESGYVVDINWRNTTIRMLPNNTVIIPNSKLASSIVTNYYLPEKEMSVVIPVSVSYEDDLEKVERITVEVAEKIQKTVPGAKRDFKPFIRYREFGDSGITFSVILRVEEFVDQYLVQHEFMKELKKRYDKEGIRIPFPQRDIWFRNAPETFRRQKKGGA